MVEIYNYMNGQFLRKISCCLIKEWVTIDSLLQWRKCWDITGKMTTLLFYLKRLIAFYLSAGIFREAAYQTGYKLGLITWWFALFHLISYHLLEVESLNSYQLAIKLALKVSLSVEQRLCCINNKIPQDHTIFIISLSTNSTVEPLLQYSLHNFYNRYRSIMTSTSVCWVKITVVKLSIQQKQIKM